MKPKIIIVPSDNSGGKAGKFKNLTASLQVCAVNGPNRFILKRVIYRMGNEQSKHHAELKAEYWKKLFLSARHAR